MNDDRHIPHETLTAFLDGELPPDERARVDAHLARCEECRATLASWADVERGLDAASPTMSQRDWDALAARVDRAIDEEEVTATARRPAPSGERSWRELLRRLAPRPVAWSAAGAFGAALLVMLLLPHEERFTPAPRPAQTSAPATEEVSKETSREGVVGLPEGVGASNIEEGTEELKQGTSESMASRAGLSEKDEALPAEPSSPAPLEKRRADDEDTGRSDAPSTGALTSGIDDTKRETESPAPTSTPPAPTMQQEAAPQGEDRARANAPGTADARARIVDLAPPLIALRDSLAALDAHRMNAVPPLAPSSPKDFGTTKSFHPANESRREAAGGATSADRPAAPDPLLAREIELVAALVAADAPNFCEEARARRVRWESEAGFAALSEESRARVAAIDAACPK